MVTRGNQRITKDGGFLTNLKKAKIVPKVLFNPLIKNSWIHRKHSKIGKGLAVLETLGIGLGLYGAGSWINGLLGDDSDDSPESPELNWGEIAKDHGMTLEDMSTSMADVNATHSLIEAYNNFADNATAFNDYLNDTNVGNAVQLVANTNTNITLADAIIQNPDNFSNEEILSAFENLSALSGEIKNILADNSYDSDVNEYKEVADNMTKNSTFADAMNFDVPEQLTSMQNLTRLNNTFHSMIEEVAKDYDPFSPGSDNTLEALTNVTEKLENIMENVSAQGDLSNMINKMSNEYKRANNTLDPNKLTPENLSGYKNTLDELKGNLTDVLGDKEQPVDGEEPTDNGTEPETYAPAPNYSAGMDGNIISISGQTVDPDSPLENITKTYQLINKEGKVVYNGSLDEDSKNIRMNWSAADKYAGESLTLRVQAKDNSGNVGYSNSSFAVGYGAKNFNITNKDALIDVWNNLSESEKSILGFGDFINNISEDGEYDLDEAPIKVIYDSDNSDRAYLRSTVMHSGNGVPYDPEITADIADKLAKARSK